MRTVVIQNPRSTATVERGILRPREGEALLKIACGDICGSDLAPHRGMLAYASYSRTIGHEFATEMVEIGDNVYGIKLGMIVTGNPYFSCGIYYSCRQGMMSCHVRNETMSVQREDAFNDYLTMPVGRLYDDQGIDPKRLALIEPFYISCHGVSRASVKPGDKVLVFGAGVTGTLAGMVARSFGTRVYTTDIAGEKVEAVVWDFHLDGGLVSESQERLNTFVQEITGEDRFDVTVEVVGAPSTFLGYVQATVGRGRAVVIGMAKHSADFNFLELQCKELEMYGSRAVTMADFAAAMKLAKDGFMDLKKPISRTYPAGSAAKVSRDLGQNYGEAAKTGLEL